MEKIKIFIFTNILLFGWPAIVWPQSVLDILNEDDAPPRAQSQEQSQEEPSSQPEAEATAEDTGQTEDSFSSAQESEETQDDSSAGGSRFLGSIVAGATTLDGKNYQQIGIRGEVPVGNFGFGFDIQVLLDEKGDIRKEDWDEGVDYLDKIYYIRWGQKNSPLYLKLGGLDSTYLGYGSIVWGYSNMVEYPTYKRVGFEMAVNTKYFGMEYFMNDFKEVIDKNPSLVTGTRLAVKPISGLSIGGSVASDTNQYKGLRDNDGDDYPDQIDYDPYNKNVVTEIDVYRTKEISESAIGELIDKNFISSIEKEDLMKISESKSAVVIYGADIGYDILSPYDKSGSKNFVSLSVYAQWAQIYETKGWGFGAPGVRLGAGPVDFSIEYRQNSDKFLFNYFNNTYELERANFISAGFGNPIAYTKLDVIKAAKAKQGFFSSLGFNLFELLKLQFDYQLLMKKNKEDENDQSLTGSLKIKDGLIPVVSEVSGYYTQNNVKDFLEWKTPSTIIGFKTGFKMGGTTSIIFDYRFTFEDVNGNGIIAGEDETIKTISISTTSRF
ncbi:MAG: hypothetical protein OEZ22_13005 [Spirochaetia bacterium]|nr:hypothetical protein [Spirochaetia bacterium]